MESAMKIGIMSFAHHHAEAYIGNLRAIPEVEMIGLADDDPARGRHYADQFEAHLYPSYEALLEEADGILVCCENNRHRALTEMAARAGVHVLSEKPLATNLADARAMIDACQEAGVNLMTAFPMRFSPPFQQVKERLDQGALGHVYCFSATNQGQMPGSQGSWFVDRELAGGGALIDHTVHLVDIMRWYLGVDVVEVYAQANHILHSDSVDVETGALLMLTFANGVFATIDASWSKPLNYPTWGGLTMEIISQRGLTVMDGFRQNLNRYVQDPPANDWLFWGSDLNQGLVEEFVSSIREGRRPKVTGEDGYQALAITMGAYESAASGQPISLFNRVM
jgi:predicted dehydrogenase